MCGIAGIVNLTTNPDQSISQKLLHMRASLQHRGEDGNGIWLSSSYPMGLAHNRLSIIDLSHNALQPMHYNVQGKTFTIVFNGEIYNYIELKEELAKLNCPFTTQSDTEVILAAYATWGSNFLQHLDGMFALAIWDGEVLFAARDRFGEKPFFYALQNNCFYFASEIKALWAAGVNKAANLKMLFNYITIGYTGNPEKPEETFYENIFKLPPANYLTLNTLTKNITTAKYWEIDPDIQVEKITDAQAFEKFNTLFNISIKRRMRSHVPFGTSLSGGIDSSFIAATCYENKHSAQSYQCFTAIFEGFENNEQILSKKVANQYNLTQHTVAITSQDLVNDWEKFCYYQEEPVASASAFAQYKVSELAAQYGVKVLLDGQGADEILAGYHKYYKWYWQELFRQKKWLGRKEYLLTKSLGIQEPFNWKNKLAAVFPQLAFTFLENQYLAHALSHPGLTKNFVQLQSREAYYSTPEISSLQGILYFNTCVHGLEELLRYADRNAMAFGREVRLPFLQHELVEFVFSLPPHFKIRNGRTKWLLRESLQGKCDDEIVWRTQKIGFEPPQYQWMQHHAVKDMIYEAKQKLVKENILDNTVLKTPIIPTHSYHKENFDWRYLSAATIL